MNSCEAMLGLTEVYGLGSISIKKLIDHFHKPELVWQAGKETLIKIIKREIGRASCRERV